MCYFEKIYLAIAIFLEIDITKKKLFCEQKLKKSDIQVDNRISLNSKTGLLQLPHFLWHTHCGN